MARTRLQNVGLAALLLTAAAAAVTAVATMDTTGERSPRTGARYVEQALAAAPVDAAQIAWAETATWPVSMDAPRGLAVLGDGRIAVVGDRVLVFAADGRQVLRSAPLAEPYRALVGGGGGAFAAAVDRIDEVDLGGSELRVLASVDLAAQNVQIDALACTAHGLFAADARGCAVWRLPQRADGGLEPGRTAVEFAARFTVPSTIDIANGRDGELVTVDPGRHKVQRRDERGDVVATFGEHGGGIAEFPGCCNPIAVAVFADGRTVTAEKGLTSTRVKVFDARGQLLGVVADRDRFDVRPDGPPIVLDVAVDGQGRVLVLDPHRRQVRLFTERERRK